MAKRGKLFDAKAVEWLKVTPKKLGESEHTIVHFGRIKFKGRRPASVAVKSFKRLYYDAAGIREIISALNKAGVRMPKMGVVEFEGKPVVVSGAYTRKGLTKLTELSEMKPALDYNKHPEFTLETARQLGLMARAGYTPNYVVEDTIHAASTAKGLLPVVVDIEPIHFRKIRIVKSGGQIRYDGRVEISKSGHKFPLALNAVHEFFLKIEDSELQSRAIRQFHNQLGGRQRKAFLHQLDPDHAGKPRQGLESAIKRYREYIDPKTNLKLRCYNRFIEALDASS